MRLAYCQALPKSAENVAVYSVDLTTLTLPVRAAQYMTDNHYEDSAIKMPPSQNATSQTYFDDKVNAYIKTLLDILWQDSDKAGKDYYESGRRLEKP
ncbi:MAG: hypothetical protein ACU84Q_00595 [Gammaproteobacteria bacterium]